MEKVWARLRSLAPFSSSSSSTPPPPPSLPDFTFSDVDDVFLLVVDLVDVVGSGSDRLSASLDGLNVVVVVVVEVVDDDVVFLDDRPSKDLRVGRKHLKNKCSKER